MPLFMDVPAKPLVWFPSLEKEKDLTQDPLVLLLWVPQTWSSHQPLFWHREIEREVWDRDQILGLYTNWLRAWPVDKDQGPMHNQGASGRSGTWLCALGLSVSSTADPPGAHLDGNSSFLVHGQGLCPRGEDSTQLEKSSSSGMGQDPIPSRGRSGGVAA